MTKNETEGSEVEAAKKRPLAVAEAPRINRFARNNPALARILEAQERNGSATLAELSQVIDACLEKVVARTPEEKLDSPEFISMLAEMETHKAKVAKLKADTESVLINVATPTAIRRLLNEYGMCIFSANEEFIGEMLEKAKTDEECDLIKEVGGGLHQRIMDKIKEKGYSDDSLAKLLAAPR